MLLPPAPAKDYKRRADAAAAAAEAKAAEEAAGEAAAKAAAEEAAEVGEAVAAAAKEAAAAEVGAEAGEAGRGRADMCGGGGAGGADGVNLASVKQRLQAADAALQAHQSKRELYASELQRASQNPTLQSTIVPVCEKELQACDAAVAAARDAKRKVEELHGAVVARDAQAVKVRKTEAGRAAATKE